MAKLWLFGPDESIPIIPDGEIIVGMWENPPKGSGRQPVLLELWHIDRESARKLRKRDFMGGESYSVFLPSGKYHVDLKQVNVIMRYNGADGRCLVSRPETLTIDHSATLQRAAEKLGMSTMDGLKTDRCCRPPWHHCRSRRQRPGPKTRSDIHESIFAISLQGCVIHLQRPRENIPICPDRGIPFIPTDLPYSLGCESLR